MYKYLIILFSIINISNSLAQQENKGIIRGTITDGVTSEALVGVNIIIESLQKVYTTDNEGNFLIENLNPLRYNVKFSFTGFRSIEKQLLVLTGKETVLNLEMVESKTILGEVDVKSNSFIALSEVVSGKSFSIEETNRIPANFFDPVRVATAFPGVVASHDQANNLIVRGNAPNTLLWRLEGINIVNPNHLSNAGTLADKPLQTGGGVNILSGQMLGNTDFLNGPMPVEYGDGYSAFGLNFRQGNNEKREYTAQASLIGLDFSTEGPIGKNGASYLVNYRYSTVGILTNVIGLDFGGEKITFQDLAFNVETPIGEKVNAKLFGFGGSSSNYFRSDDTPENWLEDKDSKDIFYDENVGMLGGSIEGTINSGSIKLTTGISGSNQSREEYDQNDLFEAVYSNQLDKGDIIWSNSLIFKSKLKGGYYRVGTFVDYNNRKLRDFEWKVNPAIVQLFEGNLEEVLIRPFTDISHALGDKLSVNAGIAYFKYNSQLSGMLEPRLSFFYDIDKSKSVTLGYGRTGSRLALYSDTPVEQAINDQVSLVYRQRFAKDWTVTSEFYYQALSNIPTSIDGSFSLFNIIDYPEFDGFVSNGRGRNYGFEIFTNKRLSNKYYLLAGGSVYQSEFLLNSNWVDSQFNGNYTVNVTSGREVIKDNKTFGINARAMYLGGFRRPEIIESISRDLGTTVFDYSSGFPIQNNDYFRVDFSINWKKNKKNYTRTIGIDIQNLFNVQNDGLSYFDVRADEILYKPQLGTIPIILYRLDF